MRAFLKTCVAIASITAVIILAQGCMRSGSSAAKKVVPGKFEARGYSAIVLTKHSAPTSSPAPLDKSRRTARRGKPVITTQAGMPVVSASIGEDFYIYMCLDGAGPDSNFMAKACAANLKVDSSGYGGIVRGPDMTSYYLKSGGDYFTGSTTVPTMAPCGDSTSATR